jgi:IS5 family transposase
MPAKRSRIHPTYKTKFRVRNWASYDRALVRRGDVTLWFAQESITAWRPKPAGRRGAQLQFSDLAIETALTLRLVFNLPLRQTEGFLRSIFCLMDLDLDAPDHTTLSRRGRFLDIHLREQLTRGPLHLVVDSSGLAVVGEGEWAAVKHGGSGKRGWRKLHLGVDGAGVIVVQCLTEAGTDDAATALDLIAAADGNLASFTADGAYDTSAVYDAAGARGARVVIPPSTTATSSRRPRSRSSPRNRTIARVQKVGRRQWKKEVGYHQQARAENAFFRYKVILGNRLRARCERGRAVEARLACSILNRMTALGRPASVAVGA